MSSTVEMANEEAVPYAGPKPYGMSDDLIIPGLWIWTATSGCGFRSPRTSSSARCCCRRARATSSTSCGCAVRGSCPATATPARCTPSPSAAAGTTSNTTGGPKRAPTRSSRPATSTPSRSPKTSTEMVTLFHVSGAYIYVDVDGNTVGIEDVFSKIDKARAHYEKIGLGADYVDQFIR